MMSKTCSKCSRIKDSHDFGKRAGSLDGLQAWCKTCLARYAQAWYQANRTTQDLKSSEWGQKHPDRRRTIGQKSQRRRYAANRVAILAERKVFYQANRGRILARMSRWAKGKPDSVLRSRTNRRARKRGADGSHTTEDVRNLYAAQDNHCANPHCDFLGKLTLDHIIPLSKGGSNWPNNLQGLCSHCNSSKRTKPWQVFLAEQEKN